LKTYTEVQDKSQFGKIKPVFAAVRLGGLYQARPGGNTDPVEMSTPFWQPTINPCSGNKAASRHSYLNGKDKSF